jgi:hypothetical protein
MRRRGGPPGLTHSPRCEAKGGIWYGEERSRRSKNIEGGVELMSGESSIERRSRAGSSSRGVCRRRKGVGVE